jgi:hypothetical protein
MSITDNTTTLDTAWTEQTISVFTSGVLTDEAACVTEVASKLKRGTLGATTTPTETQVKNWLVRAKEELAEVKDFSFDRKFAQATLTAGDYRVALPPDYNGGGMIIRDTTNDRPIVVFSSDYFDAKYPDASAESQGEPFEATIKNMELWLSPPVNGSTVIEIEYLRSGAPTTATSFDWLPELERFRCCDFAVGMAFESLHQFDLADRYLNRWGQGMAKAIKADGRRKWKRIVSCKDVFQWHQLSNSQTYRTR